MTKKTKVNAYMNMYWADYFADTRHLRPLEHCAYLLLIGIYWVRGEALPNDDAMLARMVGMSKRDWMRVKPTVVRFFFENHDRLYHKRIEAELAGARKRVLQASDAGKNGAKSRWGDNEPHSDPNGGRMATPMAVAWRPHSEPDGDPNGGRIAGQGQGQGQGQKETTSTAARAKDLAENLPDPPKPVQASPPKTTTGSTPEPSPATSPAPSPGPDPEVERWRTRILATIGVKPHEVWEKLGMKWPGQLTRCIFDWQGLGADLEHHVIPAIKRVLATKAVKEISPAYFTPAIQERIAAPKSQTGKSAPSQPLGRYAELARQQRGHLETWIISGFWLDSWGMVPGTPFGQISAAEVAKVEADLRAGNRQFITEAQLQAWLQNGRRQENLSAGRNPSSPATTPAANGEMPCAESKKVPLRGREGDQVGRVGPPESSTA